MKRPTGVTVLAVLAILGGILMIMGGVGFIGLGGLMWAAGSQGVAPAASSLTGLMTGLAFLMLFFGILELVFGVGAFLLKRWAWGLGTAIQAASIVLNILQVFLLGVGVGSVVVSIVISLVIIWYLYQPNVKSAFGLA